jgi:hypothetical protein
MLNRFLPRPIDDTYRGRKSALWIFGIILVLRLLMALNSIFFTERVAVNADGIPLATYSPAAAHTIVALFASLGLAHLMLLIIAALVLFRYRSMIPFLYALLVTEHLGRKALLYYHGLVRVGTPPGFYVNLFLLALMLTGFALSLWQPVTGIRPQETQS